MKPNSVVRMARALIIGLMTGCAAARLVQIPEPVGPAPIVLPSRDAGSLVVYTEEDSSAGEDNVSSSYKPYKVLDSSGRVLKEVSNDSGKKSCPYERVGISFGPRLQAGGSLRSKSRSSSEGQQRSILMASGDRRRSISRNSFSGQMAHRQGIGPLR